MPASLSNQQELNDILEFEQKLQRSLSPVQPNREFVTHVKTRLVSTPDVILENRQTLRSIQVLAFGLFAGILFIWMIRFLYRVRDQS